MAYESQIGTYHLGEYPELYSPQRGNNYEFIVTDIDGILRPGAMEDEDGAAFRNAQEVLRVSVQSAFVPHFTQETVSIQRGNSTVKFAGVPTFSAGTIVFHDFIGANTKEILMAWQNLSYDVYTEKVGSLDVSPYKKDCYLIEYTPDYRKVRQWVLHGCWISGIEEDAYDNSNGDRKLVTCTIEYDWAALDSPVE